MDVFMQSQILFFPLNSGHNGENEDQHKRDLSED